MEVTQTIIYLFVIAFIFDGVKILIETLYKDKIDNKEYKPIKNDISIVTSAYNEPNIKMFIDSAKQHVDKIYIAEDRSTDDTKGILSTMGDLILTEYSKYGIIEHRNYDGIPLIIHYNKSNMNKVPSINMLLDMCNTKYVFICDSDIYFSEDFKLSSEPIENDECNAIAYNVLPKLTDDSSLIEKIQFHEYYKSMNIGKKFASISKSVECISGACGLFTYDRIKNFKEDHSGRFSGEDLERTLIELLNEGKVIFSDQLIETDVPVNTRQLSGQRIKGWWCGLYTNVFLMLRVIFKKHSPLRLKYELTYNIFSLILDPIKIFSLWYLVFILNYFILGLLYLIYVLFEMYIYVKLKNYDNYNKNLSVIFIYPLYSILQLHYRISAFIYLIYKKVSK